MNNKYCLSTSSGTTAIQLAIATLKLKPNDEIIVPDYTFVSPINSIIHSNCNPVLVDIDKNNLCISISSIKKVITKKTKAIIIVHLYGNSPDMDKIINFCKKKILKLSRIVLRPLALITKENMLGTLVTLELLVFLEIKPYLLVREE